MQKNQHIIYYYYYPFITISQDATCIENPNQASILIADSRHWWDKKAQNHRIGKMHNNLYDLSLLCMMFQKKILKTHINTYYSKVIIIEDLWVLAIIYVSVRQAYRRSKKGKRLQRCPAYQKICSRVDQAALGAVLGKWRANENLSAKKLLGICWSEA